MFELCLQALEGYSGARDFTFPCWVLPRDEQALRAAITQRRTADDNGGSYIVKATSTGEGRGIFIADSFKDIEEDRQSNGRAAKGSLIVQPLMVCPLYDKPPSLLPPPHTHIYTLSLSKARTLAQTEPFTPKKAFCLRDMHFILRIRSGLVLLSTVSGMVLVLMPASIII